MLKTVVTLIKSQMNIYYREKGALTPKSFVNIVSLNSKYFIFQNKLVSKDQSVPNRRMRYYREGRWLQ